MRSIMKAALVFVALAACAPEDDLTETPAPIGQFRLGHNIAIADNVTEGPFSREFTETRIEASVQNAVAARLRRYDGDGLYHLGIVVGGLVLGQPGIPVVYAPKSVLIADVTVFDNATQAKLNDKPKRFYAGEGLRNAVPVIGSGHVRTGEEQLQNLSESLAREIEAWLRENEAWFAPVPGQVRVPYDAGTYAPRIDSLSTQDLGAAAPAN